MVVSVLQSAPGVSSDTLTSRLVGLQSRHRSYTCFVMDIHFLGVSVFVKIIRFPVTCMLIYRNNRCSDKMSDLSLLLLLF